MARRIEPCRKSPEERLDDLLDGHREASLRNEGEKYVRRAIEASDSLPNAVKFFAWALLAADASDEEVALDALGSAEEYLEVARKEMPRRLARELPSLRFLDHADGSRFVQLAQKPPSLARADAKLQLPLWRALMPSCSSP